MSNDVWNFCLNSTTRTSPVNPVKLNQSEDYFESVPYASVGWKCFLIKKEKINHISLQK